MTNKLFDIIEPEKTQSDDKQNQMSLDIETYDFDNRINPLDQNEKIQQSSLHGMLRQTGKTLMMQELAEAKIDKLVLDSLSVTAGNKRTVDDIPKINKPKTFLTTKQSKVRIILEDTKFQPSPAVMMSGKNFAEAYKNQLTGIIFLNNSDKEAEATISLTSVFDLVNQGKEPVQLSSSKFKRKLNDIAQILNKFFKDHHYVLSSIVSMVKSEVAEDKPQEAHEVQKEWGDNGKVISPENDIFEHPTR